MPAQQTGGASGFDLAAMVEAPFRIEPMQRVLVDTGISLAIPRGFEGQVRPRSGLALKKGLSIVNTPGTIDSDYRGEVKVLLINLGQEPVEIAPGDRIAQLVVVPVVSCEWIDAESLDDTERGAGGYGSTGVK